MNPLLHLFVGVISQTLPEPHAGLLAGIIFGIKASLPAELKNALITTGTLHIVALSGMNISILITVVNKTLLRFVRRPIANLISTGLIIGFIALVGASASVVRAAIMGVITLLSINFGRNRWPLFIWVLAITIMLLLNPLWVSDISFQLSALASLGILLFGNTSQKQVHGILGFFEDDLRITLAAQVFTIPLILFQFQRISLISPIANILIGWLIQPIMIAGFVLVTVGLVWMPLAQVVAWFIWVPLAFVIQVILLTSRVPFASIGW